MAKRMSLGRYKVLNNISQQLEPPCFKTTQTVLKNEICIGGMTSSFNPTNSSSIDPSIPLSYLKVELSSLPGFGGNRHFGLLDGGSWAAPCFGRHKVLSYVSGACDHWVLGRGTIMFVSASLAGGMTHIAMQPGSRVELTWTPSRVGLLMDTGSVVKGQWATELRPSGCLPEPAGFICGPKAFLTSSVPQ